MKVLELEIHNIRGIRHLILRPDGRNFVVWGSNGSGKSAVVDAIDFLLTGRVSRLMGRGTGGITLSKHGPHIDCEPRDAKVRAIIRLAETAETVEISRCMGHADELECSAPTSTAAQLGPIMSLAQRGQHVLTRREILKYVTAEAGTRAQLIQELLNISEIDDVRKGLVKASNDLDKEVEATKRSVQRARSAVNATVQQRSYNVDTVIETVNNNRAVLGGNQLSSLRATDLKNGIAPLAVASASPAVNITLLERDVRNLTDAMSPDKQAQITATDQQLRDTIVTVRSDPQLLRALSHQELTKLGLALLDETGSCPLCDSTWPPGKLREYLQLQLSKGQVASAHQSRIAELSATMAGYIDAVTPSLKKLISAAEIAMPKEDVETLRLWLDDLQSLSLSLEAAVEKYPDSRFSLSRVQVILAPAEAANLLTRVHSQVKGKFPETTPEQTAWDMLTRLEENLKALENAEDEFKDFELWQKRAKILLDTFEASRDAVLGELYEKIKDRFVYLYRQLHAVDEDSFTAKIQPEGAGLNFEVDFYGRGTHPPHALHSEGHQDSMGLCLYLALAERLTEGLIDLIILDDVMMSVDADHRRQLCHLLAAFFPQRQFLITTHDRTWANQLKGEGVVDSKGTVEFYRWNIDTGPQVNQEADMWQRIEADIQRNDIPSAAARLRRGSEQFFEMACASLQALVVYKLNSRWELGDFLPAAIGQYRNLLKKAKNAANSWADSATVDMLREVDSVAKSIYTRSNAEQWAVNASVHYNNWADLSEKDFRPVVEAFQDLYGLFECSSCGSPLRLANAGGTAAGVLCNCGKVHWNLIEKGK